MKIRLFAILSVMALLILPMLSFGQVPTPDPTGTPPMAFRFIHPAADNSDTATGGSYTIEWSGADQTEYFYLFYSSADMPGPPEPINQLPIPAMMGTYTDDDTSRVPDGNYFVQAQVTNEDGTMPGELRTSPGYVYINNSGGSGDFTFLSPMMPDERPDGNGMFTVRWTTSFRGTLNLYYGMTPGAYPDTSYQITDLVLTIPGTTEYRWDTSQVTTNGSYFICALYQEEGSIDPNQQDYTWSTPGSVLIDNFDFQFVRPGPQGAEADDSYMIEWDSNVIGDLDLYFAPDQLSDYSANKINFTPIAIPPAPGGSQTHNWIIGSTPPGFYFIVGHVTPRGDTNETMIWSSGQINVIDKDFFFTQPPPAGDNAGGLEGFDYTIEWVYDQAQPSPAGQILKLFYDTDQNNRNGTTAIVEAQSISMDADPGFYNWTFGNLMGQYFIYGEIWLPGDPAMPDSQETLIVQNYSGPLDLTPGVEPAFIITQPSRMDQIADKSFEIEYRASVSGTLIFYKDSDSNSFNGNNGQISEPLQVYPDSNDQKYKWSTAGLSDGSRWWVYGAIEGNGVQIASDMSSGNVLIQHIAEPDIIAPGQINVVAVPVGSNPNAIELIWTAPADDVYIIESGPASQYDIRYSLSPNMNNDDWDTYSSAGYTDIPGLPDDTERFTVEGLEEKTVYYFAMKAADEVPNWSSLSNIATAKTVPVELSEFYAIPGDGVITLHWSTATELDNLGWNILKKGDRSREFTKINERLIKGAGTSSTPHFYSYDDFDVRNGVVYTYILESVSTYGDLEYSFSVQAIARSNTKPIILWGGYFDTNVSERFGGNFILKAYVESVYPIEKVELLYKGIPTRITLNDEGINGDEVEGDNIYTFVVNMDPRTKVGQYLFELKAVDINGNESDVFPYLTVK